MKDPKSIDCDGRGRVAERFRTFEPRLGSERLVTLASLRRKKDLMEASILNCKEASNGTTLTSRVIRSAFNPFGFFFVDGVVVRK